MFNTKDAKAFVNSESKYLTSGLVENVNISEVKYAVSPVKGSKYISLTFAKDESTVNVTFWEPSLYKDETKEDLNKKFLKVMYRLTQIVETYYPVGDPATECQVENFEQLSNWFITAINNRDKSKLARVKLVYNKDGYLTLPTYAKYRFIEPMIKPENWEEAAVEIFKDKDILVRPITADPIKSSANPFKTPTASINDFTQQPASQPVAEHDPNALPF